MVIRKPTIRTNTRQGRSKLPNDIKVIIVVMVTVMAIIIGAYLMYTLKPEITKKSGGDDEYTYTYNTEIIDGYNETIYPLGCDSGINITGGSGAEEYGNWTEVIPSTYINQSFIITGVYIDEISANTDMYGVQIGIGNDNQTIYTLLFHGSEQGSPKHEINYDDIDKNSKVSARCQSESGGGDSLLIWISYALID